MAGQDNLHIAREIFAAWNAHDVEGFGSPRLPLCGKLKHSILLGADRLVMYCGALLHEAYLSFLARRARRGLACALLLTLIFLPSLPVMAESTTAVIAEADVSVFGGNPDENSHALPILQAGIGRAREEGALHTYLRFDLASIPNSTYLRNTFVDRATLTLLAQSFGLADSKDRFFVSVVRCPADDWVEDRMTWNTRVCKKLGQADDMVIIDHAQLPHLSRWDVSRSVARAAEEGRKKVTFVITAFKLPLEIPPGAREIVPGERFGPTPSVGFVSFWPRERVALSASAAPTLTVVYSRFDTRLVQFVSSVLAILSALGLILGVWEGVKRFWRKPG
jgi:hypothetical protein